jgi:cysteine synthase
VIDLTVHPAGLDRAVARARERGIVIPTLAQQRDPSRIPEARRAALSAIGLWDIRSENLFRITWHNEPIPAGGGFGPVNTLELPPGLTGVPARIIGLVGKWFPTGAHKVGATFGCLVPSLVTGQFDPTRQKAVWPSTGNYCRGGAYNATLLGCESIAILPEEMSRERFEWLERVSGEILATPGCESNVKEIFDACHDLVAERGDAVRVFNQFDEPGNYLWHYSVTGAALESVLERSLSPRGRFAGFVSSTGSAGTIAAGDHLKRLFPASKVAAVEALQCPTLLQNGFGGHRIEGIGDKHVPWIHNLRNTDLVAAVDDEACMDVMRLFNEAEGRAELARAGVDESILDRLDLLGISGVSNLLAAIKFARWYELTEDDVILTVFTDSMELYRSRLEELRAERGGYTATRAAVDRHRRLLGCSTDHMAELTHPDRKRIHNLKYFTWIEQQGKTYDEIQAQWYDPEYWSRIQDQADAVDALIEEFNRRTGLL